MPDWREILTRDGPAAWRTAFRLLGNRADADDCFQDACLAALDVSRKQSVRSWRALLLRLATLKALDRQRARLRDRSTPSQDSWEAIPGALRPPDDAAQDAELAHALRQALAEIPTAQAEVFCLHCLEDWSYEEIARHARLSVSAVGVSLHRARKRLRLLLAPFQEDLPHRALQVDQSGTGSRDQKEEP